MFDTFSRWHIKCFVCCTCNNVLVDLLYFCKDKKLYCKKHYCSLINDQIVAPSTPSIVCAACDQAIESSEYIKAENKFWHFDHFTCWGCEKSLGSKRYIVVDSKPYCFDCHLVHYSKVFFTLFLVNNYNLKFIFLRNVKRVNNVYNKT